MSVSQLGWLLLAVSLFSAVVYMQSIGQLLHYTRRVGLLRTACCRLVAALLYVGVGLITVETGTVGVRLQLTVFTFIQIMWQINARADVRLARRNKGDTVTNSTPPNYNQPLSNAAVSAEIDRLTSELNTAKTDLGRVQTNTAALVGTQRIAYGTLAFAVIVGAVGLIFGLVVYNRADSAVVLSQQNQAIITQLKTVTDKLNTSVNEQCSLYSSFIGFYSLRGRAASPEGPDAYDSAFRRLVASADHQHCGIAPPKDLVLTPGG